jgi:hypothetical protein
MQLIGWMSPTGHQDPPPTSGPRGVANVNFDATDGTIHTNVDFAGTGTPTPVPPGSACKEIWPLKASRLYVVAGDKVIGNRNFPPPTCSTITDDWAASSQVVQSIVASPSNAIVYVEAPPGNPGSREYLPGGVVLNPGSPWARLQAAPPPVADTNI